jgi:hypothetical protein
VNRPALQERVIGALEQVVSEEGFEVAKYDSGGMGSELLELENLSFRLRVGVERWGSEPTIRVGAKARPGPRKPLRAYWVSQLYAYLRGDLDPYIFSSLEGEAAWIGKEYA